MMSTQFQFYFTYLVYFVSFNLDEIVRRSRLCVTRRRLWNLNFIRGRWDGVRRSWGYTRDWLAKGSLQSWGITAYRKGRKFQGVQRFKV